MKPQQKEHIANVLKLVETPFPHNTLGYDDVILSSWQRCVKEHRLDPTRPQEALILPQNRLRDHQDGMEEFIQIARHGMESLYKQVAGSGYCVLLTDAQGITVDFLGDLVFEPSLKKAGLYLGADWSEEYAGTCGVGTCIATEKPLTVHLHDHFDATHIPLTCTSAPVFDPFGNLNAVLDISALTSPRAKDSQHLALQLVKVYANHIENAIFLHRFRRDWILRLSLAPQFLDMNPEYLLALDSSGKIIGHNRSLQLLLESGKHRKRILGQSFESFFNASFDRIGSFVRTRPSEERAITTVENSRLLFLLASPPPTILQSKSVIQYKESPLTKLSGGDPSLDRQIERGTKLLNSPVNILLTGETGTGKEFFARAMHESSERRSHPYIAVNCAAIPEQLIESELFGYTQGSFSGANQKGKIGLIQEADRGTLFLDEIGDMPLNLQARLLRVLAEREILPIGATKPIPVNIRVISATHCDLIELVKKGKFRDDLYYRVNGAQISLPALRDRKDLAWMIQKMLDEDSFVGAQKIEISEDVKQILLSYKWPGNLRELKNVVHYCKTICNEPIITLSDLPDSFLEKEIFQRDTPHKSIPREAYHMKELIQEFNGNITQVAKYLRVSRMTIYRRIKKWGMETQHK